MANPTANAPVSKPVGLFPPAPNAPKKAGAEESRRGSWGNAGVREVNAPF